ncbi:branched-chain amino acid transport system II carrier protein [Shewanella sp. NIFS-20-20]|uniref:branched-chain amino acid transport system II carrier protein n=1 Tax=Shewanella sp. NIFS-20-20 TaxID=2853806 RepID=UPI001C4679D1|nr:branched-chain amino acid transport system II carrier protein [Shewanella sp. NIFS-20-20]MBV7317245.1 branched-chain amino acid transport system II carrier protein [Shewanella sp. NIFS-20-20]
MRHSVKNTQMTLTDTLGLGFMTFAFFLGAGNLIFPPFAGLLAGEHMFTAMLGFLITAVGLPLIALIAVAKANGKIMAMLPVFAATALAIAIYIIIGPAFAIPRTGLVAFEIGARPFISDPDTMITVAGLVLNQAQLAYTAGFFAITMLLALFPGKLLDSVGKVLTPILLFLLVGLAMSVMMVNGAAPGVPQGEYANAPLVKGVLEGYNTMDALASLIFGMLIIDILRKKGVTDSASQTVYLIRAALIAAAGLAFVYVALFFLGVSAGDIAQGAQNGGQILTLYVTHHFGQMGVILLALVVTLACLTTAVGLVSACAEYFNELLPQLSYRLLVVVFSVICALVANVGLTSLISISIPVLMSIYPVAMALVLVTFLTQYFANPQFAHRLILSIALLFGLFDGFKAAGIDTSMLNFLPLYDVGMAWLLPTLLAVGYCLITSARAKTSQA